MKALSLTQPWADVILEQGKLIENRVDRGPWRGGCAYRGPVLLHASKGLGSRAKLNARIAQVHSAIHDFAWIDDRFEKRWWRASEGTMFYAPREQLRLGGIVGLAKIVDVIDPKQPIAGELFASTFEEEFQRVTRAHGLVNQRRFWFGGFALVLADVEPLPFVPWSGALGLFNVDLRKLVGRARSRTDAPEIGAAYSTLGAE